MIDAILKQPLGENHSAARAAADKQPWRSIPLTGIQRLIGRRMLQSKLTKPCFYIELQADVTELMGLRRRLNKKLGVKITTNSLYICALARAAQEYPLILARLDADNIRIAESINVGFAVNAPQGIIVPVIKDTERKSLAKIAQLEKTLTEKARCNKLTLEQIEGQTIALSNLGPYGTESFFGIVPPSATAILAVGNVVNKICPQNSVTAVCKMISLTLTVDGTVTSSVYAAGFLNSIKKRLQNPNELV